MDNSDHLDHLARYIPHKEKFTKCHPGLLPVCIGNTWNLRREYSKSAYPRETVSADIIGSGLYKWITGTGTGTTPVSQPLETPKEAVPKVVRKLTHKIIRRNSTFLAYKFNTSLEYIHTVNMSLLFHKAACVSLPAFSLTSPATFLMIVDIHNIILGYYRIGWINTMTACREQKIQLTSPVTTSHKYVVYVTEPCITMTGEHISELNLVPIGSRIPAEQQAIGTCVLYRFQDPLPSMTITTETLETVGTLKTLETIKKE